jgi:xanthine dehydrogenase YagS FAD-binding subunit
MRAFTYERAQTAQDAARSFQVSTAPTFIAGGTNLLDLMKLQIETPSHVIDITRLPLRSIDDTSDGGLRIGALVTNADLAANARVRKDYGVLSRALLSGATGQLRNKASTGGNLLQRTRCYYFYDTSKPCNKREPGSGCTAIGGFNRIHAILGASDHCIATHPSDMAVAMRVLDAKVETIDGAGRVRTIPIAEFYRLPGDKPQIDTNLRPGDLVTAVVLPPPPSGVQIYRKVRDRASYAFALVSVAAVVDAADGKIKSAKLAFGGVAHMPWRSAEAERKLAGATATSATFAAAADVAFAGARGHGSNDFKIPLAHRTLRAVLAEAIRLTISRIRRAILCPASAPARSGSAGTSGIPSQARSTTATGWSAWVWPRRHAAIRCNRQWPVSASIRPALRRSVWR